MTLIDQRIPGLRAKKPEKAPSTSPWNRALYLRSLPKPFDTSPLSLFFWWWHSDEAGTLNFDEEGVWNKTDRIPWNELWNTRLEVWLLSDTYLELTITFMKRPRGARSASQIAFKTVIPHIWVSAEVDLKQNAALGYCDLEALLELWPSLVKIHQAQGVRSLDHVSPGSMLSLEDWKLLEEIDEPFEVDLVDDWLALLVDSRVSGVEISSVKRSKSAFHWVPNYKIEPESYPNLVARLMNLQNLQSLSLDLSRWTSSDHSQKLSDLVEILSIKEKHYSLPEHGPGLEELENILGKGALHIVAFGEISISKASEFLADFVSDLLFGELMLLVSIEESVSESHPVTLFAPGLMKVFVLEEAETIHVVFESVKSKEMDV